MFNFKKSVLLMSLGLLSSATFASSHDHNPINEEQALRAILQCMSKVGNTLVINGCNLHISNGSGYTHKKNGVSTANAVGNLILGYNAVRYGSQTPQLDHRGSHNVVLGDGHSYQSTGTLFTGQNNTVTGQSAVIAGANNQISGNASAIMSGSNHTVEANHGVIFGGTNHTLYSDATWGSISGGESNRVYAPLASIVGGRHNTAYGIASSISGGQFNQTTANAPYAVVVGGSENKSGSAAAVVLGGRFNEANGEASTVAGGFKRATPGKHDYRAGSNYFSNQ
ncbi:MULTISPECIES: hypothetical protein [Pseudoalteromonas]|uniref:Trimeric autotransporter adhesin YadA-like head domain-containing protein n=1 Tax=Pseudoalteromonas luteoviolacea (strain 2ta16) TaxID=1353533 RepID=V4I0S2_PSEL2|nr:MULTISPECIES: hypothetical protein [Pseudoalteromonas]ESP93794.1 hypothetical protein PL2TA16_02998 [Pseudoalteromonas luteoviolacea 2ta16]KZN41092.1 hypothetical protein N483_15900 [Pseudoalteromonas luteoviolacea NCIMB 1944]MCG7550758.1 hypothetical protein [Pseudoalteromonas sp. Of7M-16]